MAHYRKVDSRLWNDQKFRALSDDGKFVFLFVMTHPTMTAIGAMRSSVPGLAAELGWTEERLREGFQETLAKGMVEADGEACCVALPRFLRYNRPESPNVVKAWASALDLIPECALKTTTIERVRAFTEGLSEAFREALPEAFGKAMPYQEQEQEQEPEQEQKKEQRAGPPDPPAAVPEPANGSQRMSIVDLAASKRMDRSSPEQPLEKTEAQQALESAIYREALFNIYDNGILGNLSFSEIAFEVVKEATGDLFGKRSFRELRGVGLAAMRETAWNLLRPDVERISKMPARKRRSYLIARAVEVAALAGQIEAQKEASLAR